LYDADDYLSDVEPGGGIAQARDPLLAFGSNRSEQTNKRKCDVGQLLRPVA
jgi:hypothetical protein